jgi:GNAT superfamily N-acetyltransferase
MTGPDAPCIYEVIDATWPAADLRRVGPWVIREGRGGGSRVSAASAQEGAHASDIAQAEDAMRALGQPLLFQIRATDTTLDTWLADRGYAIMDPVNLYAAPIPKIATERPPPVTSFEVWPPLQAQRQLWEAGGINANRIAVMARAQTEKVTLLGRYDDRPAGCAYLGIAKGCAMIHALEVAKFARRQGLARHLTRAAAFWAQDHGVHSLTLVTTQANDAANALYTSLGMQLVGQYHYRIKRDASE